MSAHDDAARDTANARADALAALGLQLKAVTAERNVLRAERDELAAKVARVREAADRLDRYAKTARANGDDDRANAYSEADAQVQQALNPRTDP